jgi:hypothetical protein
MIDNDSCRGTLMLETKMCGRQAIFSSSLMILPAFLFGSHDALLPPRQFSALHGGRKDSGQWK